MKKVLFVFSDGMGCMVRMLPYMVHLRNVGNEVAFFTISYPKDILISKDFKYVEIKLPEIHENNIYKYSEKWSSWEEFYGMIGFNDKEWIDGLFLDFIDGIKIYKPDLIISDVDFYPNVVAKILQIPCISFVQSCFLSDTYKKQICWWDKPLIRGEKEYAIVKNINYVIKKWGLKEINSITELYIGDYTIIPSFPEFDCVDSLKENMIYLGPHIEDNIFGNNENCENLFSKFSTDSFKIFAYIGRLEEKRSKKANYLVLDALIQLSKNKEYSIVFSDYYNSLSNNIISENNLSVVKGWIPTSQAYKNSNLIIHHGGHSSSMANFIFGAPAIILPTTTEREYNARSIDKLKCGELLLPEYLMNDPNIFVKTVEKINYNYTFYKDNIINWQMTIKQKYPNPIAEFMKIYDKIIN